MLSRRWAAAVAVAALCVVAPVAQAHKGNPNFRSEVSGLKPALKDVKVRVLRFDDSIELEDTGGHTILVKGYRGEPYVEFVGGAVLVNTHSPTYHLNDDRFAEGVDVPADATPKATPEWQQVDGTGRYAWHDHRIHWMSHALPPQVKDKSERTKVFDWRVPLEVDGRPGAITGTLTWVGRPDGGGFPAAAAISLALAVIAGLVLIVVVRRRRRQPAPAAGPKEAW